MPTFGFLIDNRKCIGCHACTVACKSEHEVPIGVDRTWVKYIEKGVFPNNRRLFTVMRCNHCEWAPCVTICPVTALYRRDDGVVDFNSDRCIGCKACMQACPYDALYIDPSSNTAAKCNFCTHRLEVGLEPSCVVVCPEQAIVCGDLDDAESEISRLVERHPVQVRKPEKGTRPKLYYIDGDQAALVPTQTEADGRYMWSRSSPGEKVVSPEQATTQDTHGTLAVPESSTAFSTRTTSPDASTDASTESPISARRTYDVRPRKAPWGWPVVAYTWTKSIAAGSFLAAIAAQVLSSLSWAATPSNGTVTSATAATGGVERVLAQPDVSSVLGGIALLFLVITSILLVVDLKRPERFLYVLLRPQWNSWLVRGAYVLVAYGIFLTGWLVAHLGSADRLAGVLAWPCAILAVFSAIYTAFLFAQAKGRDMWQNPLLSLHLLAHALLAGTATWLLVELFLLGQASFASRACMMGTLVFGVVAVICEIFTTLPTDDARRAMDWIVGRPQGALFWGVGIGLGHVVPILLLNVDAVWSGALAAILALSCLMVIERLWVLAPQRIPLS